MKTIEVESTIFFDVDDTIVMWDKQPHVNRQGFEAERVAVRNPHDGIESMLLPHHGHIKIMKDRKARGSCIVVWSAGGFAWAEAVVKALGLEEYVDYVMTKPHMYVDDKKAEEFMKEHLYIPYESNYGR